MFGVFAIDEILRYRWAPLVGSRPLCHPVDIHVRLKSSQVSFLWLNTFVLKKLFSTNYIFLTIPFLLIVRRKKTTWANSFTQLLLRYCVDCPVSCVLCWLHSVGKKNMAQSAWSWSGGSTSIRGGPGRQSMNRTSTVGQLLKGSNTSQRNIQDTGNRGLSSTTN